MTYQIIPNILFILSVLGIVLIVLRRLPEAGIAQALETKEIGADERLIEKGLPAQAFSKVKVFLSVKVKKVWNFALEAKDLKPQAMTGYKIKKIFSKQKEVKPVPQTLPQTFQEVKTENYYLDMIKLQPKNRSHYDSLGKYYLEQEQVEDARDIYQYLVNHEPANSDFQARLGFCFYQTQNYEKAAQHYAKSLALDSTQPNRYYNLGLSWEAAGNLHEAIKSFQSAINLEPSAKYYIGLSNAYIKLGKADQAKTALLSAQDKEPDNEAVKVKLERFVQM